MQCVDRLDYTLTMRSVDRTGAARPRTFTETARRAQIVGAAVDVIAEVGYAQASLARIADQLDISKGVILYHFVGKEDLVREVVAHVWSKGEAFVRQRMQAAPSGVGKLRAYIEACFAYMVGYPNDVIAIVDIARSARDADGTRLFDSALPIQAVTDVQKLLIDLRNSDQGTTDFDPAVMALAIRAAIDAVADRLRREPDLDVDLYGRELATLFERAIRGPTKGSHSCQ